MENHLGFFPEAAGKYFSCLFSLSAKETQVEEQN